MKRAKIKPKKRKKINVSVTELNKIKRDVTKTATDKACLILLAAVVDEMGLTDDQLCQIMERTDRYAKHVDNHLVKMEDIRKTIEKGTEIKMCGWID